MSTADRDAEVDVAVPNVGDLPPTGSVPADGSVTAGGAGDGYVVGPLRQGVVACACPDCHAPMAVRLWLMTADCWRCQTSIDLSLEQVDALRLAASRAPDVPTANDLAAPNIPGVSPAPPPLLEVEAPPQAPAPVLRRTGRPLLAPAPAAEFAGGAAPVEAPLVSTGGLHDLLSWLTSAIVHLLLLILLMLLSRSISNEGEEPFIVLSVDFNENRLEDELPNDRSAVVLPDFDLPVSRRPTNQQERDRLRLADQDARQIRLDRDARVPTLPDLASIRDNLHSDDPYRRMLAARDPRIRAEVVRREGGTTMTEAAVARALRWLARHQHPDGSWRLFAFHEAPSCDGRCRGLGRLRSAPGATGLALQAFLGAGQTHRTGVYRDVVSHGLQYLLGVQDTDGDLRGESDDNAGMYAHAQATIVLCDAYQLTGDEALRGPAEQAIAFLCDAQHRAGGWRYRPNQRGDTSVIGWQLMALHSARAGRLRIPSVVLERAGHYLDHAQSDDDGATYAYQPGGRPTPAMTAEGLLSRMYLGWSRQRPGLQLGVALLASEFPPDPDAPDLYYWYYATQVMHHWGGRPWNEWNRRIRDLLVATQETAGCEAGSWMLGAPHDLPGGRLYMTALACCTLEVYYRHAPLFRKIDLR